MSLSSIELIDRYAAKNYGPLPVVIERAEGAWLWDDKGRRFMDFMACYSALNFGHRNPKILAAVQAQCERVTLTSRAYLNTELGPLCKELADLAGLDLVLPMNSGAEAVETAVKTARYWGHTVKGVPEGKQRIVAAERNFHGRTTTVISFSTEQHYRKGFGPYTPGFDLVPFGDAAAIERAISPDTVGVLIEPIQGEGGVYVPPDGYLQAVREICKKHNVLFVLDEVQTGLGRTGKVFAFQHEGDVAKPDLLILGKALGGGVYPVSAVVGTKEALGVLKPGHHGSTFGGNPLAMAIARASLHVLAEGKYEQRAAELGQRLLDGLRSAKLPGIKEVRGRGLLIGVEITPEVGPARRMCERLLDNELLTWETHETVIRLTPPLVLENKDIDWALERLEKAFKGAK